MEIINLIVDKEKFLDLTDAESIATLAEELKPYIKYEDNPEVRALESAKEIKNFLVNKGEARGTATVHLYLTKLVNYMGFTIQSFEPQPYFEIKINLIYQ